MTQPVPKTLELTDFQKLAAQSLGYGARRRVHFSYVEQAERAGTAQAFLRGAVFMGGQRCALGPCDNIFCRHYLSRMMQDAALREHGATVFAYPVHDPERYGVSEIGSHGRALGLEVKPKQPKSPFAVTELYFHDSRMVEFTLGPESSARNELGIPDLDGLSLERGHLRAEFMGRGVAWLDIGTHESLLETATFIQIIEKRRGLKIACPIEIAFRSRYIYSTQLERLAAALDNSGQSRYLRGVLESPGGP